MRWHLNESGEILERRMFQADRMPSTKARVYLACFRDSTIPHVLEWKQRENGRSRESCYKGSSGD